METRIFHTYVALMVVACGFQFKDEDIKVGVTYKVQYLGSVEVAFDQTDQAANQKASETAVSAMCCFPFFVIECVFKDASCARCTAVYPHNKSP